MVISSNIKYGLIGVAVGTVLGIILMYKRQEPVVIEKAAPAIVTENGAYVPRREPKAPIPKPIKQAAKELDSKVVRAGSLIITDAKPEFQLDWGLVKNDQGNRIVFSTDDGTITGGVDIPVQTQEIKVYPTWTVGVLVPVQNPKGLGPTITRHFGPINVGVAAANIPDKGWTGFATASVSW